MTRSLHTLVKHGLTAIVFIVCVPTQADCMLQATELQQACDTTADLSSAGLWEGEIDSEKHVCLLLHMERGQFARVRIEKRSGFDDYVDPSVYRPSDSVPFLRVDGEIPQRVLSWQAHEPGTYTVVLSIPSRARDVKVTVLEIEHPDSLAARRAAEATDPRVAWLADRAIPIRTLDLADVDFADLEPLRPLLDNTRVVLLGEADHGDGSDFLAKSRLVRFLHAEMGFDVLAFESGLWDMWRAGREIADGGDPMVSFAQGASFVWSYSRQLEPLVAYVAAAARSPRPLVLAGFDLQPSGGGSDTMIAELRTFLEAERISGPFADPESPESQLLKRLHGWAYRPAPDSMTLASFESAVGTTADRIEQKVNTPVGWYWARILRNDALLSAWVWPQWPNARTRFCATETCRNSGDRYLIIEETRGVIMAENLSWLANHQYPGRKIIVWAHNAHIMRNLSLTESGTGSPYSMGDGVWSEFGSESYAIALVSYQGSYRWPRPQSSTLNIVPDQRPEAEFEELMAAVGLPIALVDIRAAVAEGAWLAGPFLARPINHYTDQSRWGLNVDAFLFIRNQEPSVAIPTP